MIKSQFSSSETTRFLNEISSKCHWSDVYPSLKDFLQENVEQFPFLVSFLDKNLDENSSDSRPILFFERSKSTKLILRPLQQLDDQHFEHFPRTCTFAATESFKGLFEFVIRGRRSSRIFSRLDQLIEFASTLNCATIFMSRNTIGALHQNPINFNWTRRRYSAGGTFQAQRIHRSHTNYVECLDEDGLIVFLKLDQVGRFSFIASYIDEHESHPEQFLHSTNSPQLEQILHRLGSKKDICIRLVRGDVPLNFVCQHFQIVRRVAFDTFVGLTSDGFIVECSTKTQTPFRYATNLKEISVFEEKTLKKLVEQAKHFYRDDFQLNIQLFGRFDWIELFSYWKWTGELKEKFDKEQMNLYRNPRHSNFLVSIRVRFPYQNRRRTFSSRPKDENRRSFFTQMSKLLASSTRYPTQRPLTFILNNDATPFDNSIYESNSRIRI